MESIAVDIMPHLGLVYISCPCILGIPKYLVCHLQCTRHIWEFSFASKQSKTDWEKVHWSQDRHGRSLDNNLKFHASLPMNLQGAERQRI
jgi:hypothetical protein